MDNNLRQHYESCVSGLTGEIRRLRRRNRMFVGTELATFITAIALVAAYTVAGEAYLLAGAAAMGAIYIAVRKADARNSERTEHRESLRGVYAGELRYLDGDFSAFDDGTRYADPKHAYTFDMDIFGPLSLYNRICRTVTSGGADYLAGCLGRQAPDGDKDTIDRRREAIRRLAGMERERTEFMAMSRHGRIDTPAVREAIQRMRLMRMPRFASSKTALAAAVAAQAVFDALILLAVFTPMSTGVAVIWGLLQLFAVLALSSGPLRQIGKAAGRLHKQLKAYTCLVGLISTTGLKDCGDSHLDGLGDDDCGTALRSFDELRRILDGLDRRGNVLGLILFDIFLLSDFFLVRRFSRWQSRHLDLIERWTGHVSTVDALVSMATFCHNEPEAGSAEIVSSDGIVFEASGLYHPFLGAKAVRNDFDIADGHYYIVTGANMAGKSTFLRSIGVNYILAANGMPVFAGRLRVSLFNLFSSMRTSDDLGHGISYFNAELLRLRQLIESCKHARRTLIILDEILKGTNSLDKLNGSRMFLDAISALPVSGVIATHDLELSKMADERPDRFHNRCFEIKLADDITYTYRLTQGVARNQNATHLLRNIIAEINKG